MKLSSISISYYRSITEAYKISMSNMVVLIGKNNEGKTNIIKAIILGMSLLEEVAISPRKRFTSKRFYDWKEDFPISLQNSKKLKNKVTKIRLDFLMSESESAELSNRIDSNINNEISIYIEINSNNIYSITVPKKGKNAKAITVKIGEISKFICESFDFQYIPAIRSEQDAYHVIYELVNEEITSIDDQVYKDSLEYIEKKRNEQLDLLANRIKTPLKNFLPAIKNIRIYFKDYPRYSRLYNPRNLNIEIDDGVLTSLNNKGDGVKSLATIAMLSETAKSQSQSHFIIVDEPENHLHPEAIHYIDKVLRDISLNHQVLISTHNQIFVNRSSVASNIIVDGGQAKKASRIDEIRTCLGVKCSDNLMYSDYVIVVEGPTDRDILTTFLSKNTTIKKYIDNCFITIRNIGGTNNLLGEIYSLQRYCCNYLVVLDYDRAGKEAVNQVKNLYAVKDNQVRYFMKPNKKDTELEDLIDESVYKDYLLTNGIDITNPIFKNKSLKWSDRISSILAETGVDFTNTTEAIIKQGVTELAIQRSNPFNETGDRIIQALISKIVKDIEAMRE